MRSHALPESLWMPFIFSRWASKNAKSPRGSRVICNTSTCFPDWDEGVRALVQAMRAQIARTAARLAVPY